MIVTRPTYGRNLRAAGVGGRGVDGRSPRQELAGRAPGPGHAACAQAARGPHSQRGPPRAGARWRGPCHAISCTAAGSPHHPPHQVAWAEPELALGVQAAVVTPVVVALRRAARRGVRRPTQPARLPSYLLPPGTEAAGRLPPGPARFPPARRECLYGACWLTFVRMSSCVSFPALWCTLMMRCTMGMSLPSVLNTTTSPVRTGCRGW